MRCDAILGLNLNTNAYFNSFIVTSCRFWNALLPSITLSQTLVEFREKFYLYLLEREENGLNVLSDLE